MIFPKKQACVFPTDIHALGAILYEMLTGPPPFKAATVPATLEQVRKQDTVPPSRLRPGIPAELDTICSKCLRKDPAERYGSALALAQDLGAFARRIDPGPARGRAAEAATQRMNRYEWGGDAYFVIYLALDGPLTYWAGADAGRSAYVHPTPASMDYLSPTVSCCFRGETG